MKGSPGQQEQENRAIEKGGLQSFLPTMAAFALTAYLAVHQRWSLQEFCWCVWLAGLFYSWACVIAAVFQIMLTSRAHKTFYDERIPFMKNISPEIFALGIIPMSLLVGFVALYVYTWLFSFYGLFLSVFAEMRPLNLFGRNGFINSDFFTPVAYLATIYWPVIVATLIANAGSLLGANPWERIVFPFKQNEILRIHIMIVLMPFLAMLTYALFKDAYPQLTLVLLIGIFYLLPKKQHEKKGSEKNTPTTSRKNNRRKCR